MKPLPQQYRKNSYDFNLVEREGDVAIYEQIDPDTKRRVAFEVFEVLKKPERNIGERVVEANEGCPSNEDWGTFGFTVWTLEAAKEKQKMLLENIQNRIKKRESANQSQPTEDTAV